jgi:hypothetical protein
MESTNTVPQYGLGRLFAPDERDCEYLAKRLLSAEPDKPRAKYRYYKLGPRINQGNTPQCVGYSARNFLAASPKMRKHAEPHPTVLYRGAQEHDEWPGNNYAGSSVRGAAKYMQQQGYITGDYLWAFDVETVLDWILRSKGPVIFGTNWYTSMYEPDKKGFVTLGGRIDGGHAYLVYGANEAKGTLSCVNSWGPTWGKNGTFGMSLETAHRLINEYGEALMSTEV